MNLNRARTASQRKYSTVNMTRFQRQLLADTRLDVDAATHIVNLCGAIVKMKLSKYGTGGPIMATVFNTQVGNGKYCLQFETDNKEHYMLMQSLVRLCMDRTNIRLIDADSLIEDLEFLAKHEDSFR